MKYLEKIKVKDNQRVIIVGDIHGCLSHLEKLLDNVGYSPDDIVVCCGDLIDRGPDSVGVVNKFIENPNFYSNLGNHKHLVISQSYSTWLANGGLVTYNQITGGGVYTRQHLIDVENFAKVLDENFPILIEINFPDGSRVVTVHGGIPAEYKSWNMVVNSHESTLPRRMMWDRKTIAYGEDQLPVFPDIDFMVHGHNTIEEVFNKGQRVYIDTACGFAGGKLSAIIFNGTGKKYSTIEGVSSNDLEQSPGEIR